MRRFDGNCAVILGASAEGGTGWAVARAFAEAGARLVVAARRIAPLEKLARLTGGDAICCNAASPEDIEALRAFAVEKHGKVDIAVNSAGLPVTGRIAEARRKEVSRALDVNYQANVFFIKEMAASMPNGGAITIISSLSTVRPVLPHFAYACAKAATDCLVRYAALEYGPRGVRVNSLLPGLIKSDMTKELFATPGVEDVYARETPLGRVGRPQDYADAALWLASADFVTGLNIPVDGGAHLTRMPRPDELPLGEGSYDGDYA